MDRISYRVPILVHPLRRCCGVPLEMVSELFVLEADGYLEHFSQIVVSQYLLYDKYLVANP